MTTHLSIARRATAKGLVLAALAISTTAGAQSRYTDPRWEPWLGCWQAGTPQNLDRGPVVCVTALGGGSAVEVATVSAAKVVTRDTIDASGEKRALRANDCTGWRRAEWSRDSRRVYLYSELTCAAQPLRTSTGMIAMSSGGEWLDIQSAAADGNAGVRSARYYEVGPGFVDLPAEFANVISGRARLPYAVRALAGSGVGAKDVIEASVRVDSLVVQSWLAERQQRFSLDAKTLGSLADAGVPGSVTDIMIATSFPERFALQKPVDERAGDGDARVATGMGASRAAMSRCANAWDPTWYPQSAYDSCGGYYGYRGIGGGYYGYNPYDAYYYGPYRYGAYGYGGPVYYGGYPGGYSSPIVIVKDPGKPELPHGRVINGQGYTRNSGSSDRGDVASQPTQSSSRGAAQSGSTGRSSSGSSSSGSSSSGSSSSGSSSSGSSSTGRTAQRRGGH